MAQCPQCKRNSLEYSEGKLAAWCLYLDCSFSQCVKDYADYALKFEESNILSMEEKNNNSAFAS